MGELVNIPNVDLLATGTWQLASGRQTFTTKDLRDAIDASKCPAVGNPVIKLGHVDPRFDGEPALGSVRNLRVSANGTRLLGDFTGLPAWLGDVMASAYPNRSVEGYHAYRCQIGHLHPFALTGLALLGVTPPGVGTLNTIDDVRLLLLAASWKEQEMTEDNRWIAAFPGAEPPTPERKPTPAAASRKPITAEARHIIIAAVDRGAISGDGAAQWVARAQSGEDISALDNCAGGFYAHSNAQALQQAHEALDRGHQANYSDDEFAGLFPPSAPLGPDDEDDDEPGQRAPGRKPVTQRAAAGMTEDELTFRVLFGRNAPAGYFDPEPGE